MRPGLAGGDTRGRARPVRAGRGELRDAFERPGIAAIRRAHRGPEPVRTSRGHRQRRLHRGRRAVPASCRARRPAGGAQPGEQRVRRAAEGVPLDELIVNQRVVAPWQGQGRCYAAVQAVSDLGAERSACAAARGARWHRLGKPLLAFAVSSYRILRRSASTTRRAAAEVIDCSSRLIERGFSVRRTLRRGEKKALREGGCRGGRHFVGRTRPDCGRRPEGRRDVSGAGEIKVSVRHRAMGGVPRRRRRFAHRGRLAVDR